MINCTKLAKRSFGYAKLLVTACLLGALQTPAFAVDLVADSSTDLANVSSNDLQHPLAWTVDFAASRSDYIRRNVRDYTCRLIKRERIGGELQAYQFARIKVRSEQRIEGEVVKPMAVFMQFMAPARIKDRRILYIAGENDGQVLVRKGGSMMKHVKISIDPYGRAAKKESNYPITHVGFDKFVDRLVEIVKQDIERDPSGENTVVSYFRNAKVGKRKCTQIRVEHPEQKQDMQFHIATLFVDDELNVPVRLVTFGWPDVDGEQPPLNEEYTYIDLKLNVGLTDADFSESKLSPRRKQR
jgi:hypothetical protein